ncbi:MAG: NERD domain-containing protein [Lentisphaeria bacterium]|nr:NERD domain-containing protein [Lentisphaeria bacterium]
MAHMIPVECNLTRRPMSERIVFDAIKKYLPDDWYVFHSFDYVTRNLNRQRWDGEIDFLLYHPQKGLLVIEVKGGAISYRKGQWYQEDRDIDPVEQAKRNKYAVKRLLEESLHREIPLKFAHGVCFPSCRNETVWPAEAKGIVLTGAGLPYILNFTERVLDETPLPKNISGSVEPEDILRVLSPFFEYGKKLSDRIQIEEQQFFLFTEQQCAILDALASFPRLQVKGCAGSGKTILAVKKAKKLAAQGAKVLLLCFNQLLAEHLKREVEDHPSIKAAAFFEFCIELLKIPEIQVGKYRNNPKLYSDVLPNLLKEYLNRTNFRYDAVVVDEGQDFTPQAWEAISGLVSASGPFYIFYDPDQNIFTSELKLPDFGIPPVVLTRNCRNTKKIFEALKPYQTTASEIMDSAPEGSDIHVLHGDCRDLLEKELERLTMTEQIPLQDIVILGAHSMKNTSIADRPEVGRFHIVERAARIGAMEVSYYTYMKFKGCESKVAILLDVNDSDPRWASKNGIYTAMSRAVHQLVIIRK